MSYKTILVHVDQTERAAQVVELAAAVAMQQEAHLVGLASTGVTQFIYQCSAVPPGAPMLPEDFTFLTENAIAALAKFDAQARQLGVLSFEARRIDEAIEDGLLLQSRYCDLLVMSQPAPAQSETGLFSSQAQYVALHSARPVLMVPYAGQFKQVGRRALLAWDGSQEACRAITAALPLLRHGGTATLAIFNPQAHYNVHGEQPGADMALYLARHGIKVEVLQQDTPLDIGDALLSLAADINADLLVMGCYGHTRLRELVLGGATRTVLRTMTLPVLMAH